MFVQCPNLLYRSTLPDGSIVSTDTRHDSAHSAQSLQAYRVLEYDYVPRTYQRPPHDSPLVVARSSVYRLTEDAGPIKRHVCGECRKAFDRPSSLKVRLLFILHDTLANHRIDTHEQSHRK